MNRKIDSVVKQAKQSRNRAQSGIYLLHRRCKAWKVKAEGRVPESVGTLCGRGIAIPPQDCRERKRRVSSFGRWKRRKEKEELLRTYAKTTRKTVAEALPEWLGRTAPCVSK